MASITRAFFDFLKSVDDGKVVHEDEYLKRAATAFIISEARAFTQLVAILLH